LFERQGGEIDSYLVKASLRRLDRFRKGMCMVGVKENRYIGFFPQAFHESGKRARAHEIPFAFGGSDEHWNSHFARGGENRFQQHQVRDIEVAKGRPLVFQSRQDIL
jgi:hypothetical protein